MIDVEQVKQQINIVEIASQYTQLNKSGRVYKGLCPIHDERTESFVVYPDTNSFNCYGCNIGGDVFELIQQVEGIDFKQALNRLCDDDIEVCNISPNRNNMKEFMRLIEELKQVDTGEVFGEHLVAKYKQNQHKMMVDEFKQSTLDYFDIGYCDDQLSELFNRICIPWYSVDDKLVAISGRATWDSNNKYLAKKGSSKQNHLYNLNIAKKYAKNGLILVEDEKSVWRLREFGYFNVVAMGNCELGDRKYLLRQYTDTLIIATDECQSGYKAAKKMYNECKHMFVIYNLRWDDKYKDIAEIRDNNYFDECYKRKERL